MKIVKIKSGLGNQMFQYAFARAYEKTMHERVTFDLSQYSIENLHNGFELTRVFSLEFIEAPQKDVTRLGTVPSTTIKRIRRKFFPKKTHIIEHESSFDTRFYSVNKDACFEGYWQNERYFEAIKDDIPHLFSFAQKPNEKTRALIDELSLKVATPPHTASIHVRRGDYLLHINKNLCVCTKQYYEDAFSFLTQQKPVTHLVVFSDDCAWCKQNLSFAVPRLTFVDWNHGADAWQDMYLMSLCQNNIISNSSFSWWGAYLNQNPEKTVIAPSVWNKQHKNATDIIPRTWNTIDV